MVDAAIRRYTDIQQVTQEQLCAVRELRVRSNKIKPTNHRALDALTAQAIQQFRRLLPKQMGMVSLVLFGSRARGDHEPDSDADVMVLLDGEPGNFVRTKLDMADLAYAVLLDTGIKISPLPVWMTEWANPDQYQNPQLLKNIRKDGVSA